MKNWFKIVLGMLFILIGIILIDVVGILVISRPIFAIKDKNIYKGLLFNTYSCDGVIVKFKWEDFYCGLNNGSDISMTIKDGSLSRKGATIIIKDISDDDNVYGLDYRIEKKIDDNWVKLKTIKENYGWDSVGYYVGKNHLLELEIDWEWLYGELDDGLYRLVKNFSGKDNSVDKYLVVEFKIG